MQLSRILFPLALRIAAASALPAQQTALRLEGERPFAEASRQIHLDFHTSEAVDSIGADFDGEQFKEALRVGNVNAVNLFAKGHHSWSYYPTEVGTPHPNLSFDLLKAQIEACREMDVRPFAYFTVGWSANDAKTHPEWAVVDRAGTNPYREQLAAIGPDGRVEGWEYLEPSGAYAEYIYRQVEELARDYDIDGVWFDIHQPESVNFNAWSLADYEARGIDPADSVAVQARTDEKYEEFFARTREIIAKYKPEASVYYNGTTRTYNSRNVVDFKKGFHEFNTKHDLEDLPTAWGGYDIFPWRSKYFANTGKAVVAMSGKFHKAWGEFGGFKDKEALRYEAATMVAFGASCNIGDQLHPRGAMDMGTYENVGYAFDYVEKIENYGVGAEQVARTGLYTGEDLTSIDGAVGMLLEEQVNFDVVNTLDDWSDLEVIVVTSGGILPEHLDKVRAYAEGGGRLVFLGEGFLLDGEPVVDIGADYLGPATYDDDYTVVTDALSPELLKSPFLNYGAGLRLAPKPGTTVLGRIHEPYFSRTAEHYSSHANTPYRTYAAAHPSIVRSGGVITFAHDIDRQYAREGAKLHRDIFAAALGQLRERPMVTTELPSMGRLNLLHQPDRNRYVAHLTYASPIQRGSVRVIEDIVPLRDVPLAFDLPVEVTRAYTVPGLQELEITDDGDAKRVTLDELNMHVGVVLEYAGE